MSDYFVGEIRMFAGNYAPQDWAICDGSLRNINDYPQLFALIATTYGGDGVKTFALPDFRGRIPVGTGQAPDIANVTPGARFGSETFVIREQNMPPHSHSFNVTPTLGDKDTASGTMLAMLAPAGATSGLYRKKPSATVTMHAEFLEPAGTPVPPVVNNVMPSLVIQYIIALNGIYPEQPN